MSGILSGVFTLLLTFIFLAIVVWAYSSRNKDNFEKMAKLPLEDGEPNMTDANDLKGK